MLHWTFLLDVFCLDEKDEKVQQGTENQVAMSYEYCNKWRQKPCNNVLTKNCKWKVFLCIKILWKVQFTRMHFFNRTQMNNVSCRSLIPSGKLPKHWTDILISVKESDWAAGLARIMKRWHFATFRYGTHLIITYTCSLARLLMMQCDHLENDKLMKSVYQQETTA